jgi:hypothetical protein
MRTIAWITAAAVAAAGLANTAQAKVLYYWVELGEGESATVRAVTDGACPNVIFDGAAMPMLKRSDRATRFQNVKPAAFNVTGCEVLVPRAAKAAVIEGDPVALPRTDPRRIVVFGDTGCRIAKGERVQDCKNAWPFPEVARLAAAAHPDLVIHVGDYLYREEPCPAGNAGCAGTPYGFGWDGWEVDFFKPADPLLRSSPWIFVRGNHEDCNRAAEGWFRLLDRASIEQSCRDFSGIFVSRLGNFGVVDVDGAKAADNVKDAKQAADELRRQFATIRQSIPEEAWLVSHRPFDAMRPGDGGKSNQVENKLQSEALAGLIPPGVRMLVAGHIHFFQAVDFGGKAPPQLVVGTGGDNLSPIPPMSLAGSQINGKTVAVASAYSGFAYMVWDRTGNDWSGTLFGFDGKSLNNCRLSGRSLICNH